MVLALAGVLLICMAPVPAERRLPPDLGLPSPTPPSPWPAVLTDEDCARIALARSPLLQVARAQMTQAVARVGTSASGLFPQLSVVAGVAQQQVPAGPPLAATVNGAPVSFQTLPSAYTTGRAGLSLHQLIADGGQLRAMTAGGLASARALRQDVVQGARKLVHDVRRAYLDVLQAEATREVAEKGVTESEEHLKMAQKAFESGLSARADIVSARVPVAEAHMAVTRQKTRVREARAQLNHYLGLSPDQVVALAPDLHFVRTAWTRDEALAYAREHRADLLAADQRVTESRQQLASVQAENGPRIGLDAGWSVAGYSPSVQSGTGGWNVGVDLSLPLLDGQRHESRLLEAQARVDEMVARRQQTLEDLELQVTQAQMELELAGQEADANQARVREAEENLSMTEGQYQAGLGTMLSVRDAEAGLLEARTRGVQSHYGVEAALLDLELAIGQ